MEKAKRFLSTVGLLLAVTTTVFIRCGGLLALHAKRSVSNRSGTGLRTHTATSLKKHVRRLVKARTVRSPGEG